MQLPVLFRDRSRPQQLLLGGVAPAVLGALQGVLIGVSSVAYWIFAGIAGLGAFLAGFEHRDGWGGADRGMVGGAIYGAAILLVHWLIGNHEKVSLGSFKPFYIVVTAIFGIICGALGGRIARGMREKAGAARPEGTITG